MTIVRANVNANILIQINGVADGSARGLFIKMPGVRLYIKKTLIPFKVQSPPPSIGLHLYQLGVHIRARRKKRIKI